MLLLRCGDLRPIAEAIFRPLRPMCHSRLCVCSVLRPSSPVPGCGSSLRAIQLIFLLKRSLERERELLLANRLLLDARSFGGIPMADSAQTQAEAAAAAQQAQTAGNLHLQQIQLQHQQLQQQQMQMQMFWQNQTQEIGTIDPGNSNMRGATCR